MPKFNFKDYEVYYEVDGVGRPILFLNGIMMSTASWNTFKNTVTKTNTLVRVDFLDQGNSSRMDGITYDHNLQAELLHALIEHLELKNLTICGVSYGGEVALRHALYYPQDVERLVLANAAAWTSNWLRDIGRAWNAVGKTLDGDAYYDLAIPVIYSSEFYQKKEEWMENRRKVLVPLFSTKAFQNRMERLVNSSESHDLRTEIHKIECETLVISSLYDNLTPLCEQELIVKELKNVHHVILPHCGHASMYEDPLLFISLVLGFANAKDTKYVI